MLILTPWESGTKKLRSQGEPLFNGWHLISQIRTVMIDIGDTLDKRERPFIFKSPYLQEKLSDAIPLLKLAIIITKFYLAVANTNMPA